MNRKQIISSIAIGLLCGLIVVLLTYYNLLDTRTIHVVIEPITDFSTIWVDSLNDTITIKEGYAIYYDDYYSNLHWKKNIVIKNSMGEIISEAVSKANSVASPVVIICHKNFEFAFKLTANMYPITNPDVTFQYYGTGIFNDIDK